MKWNSKNSTYYDKGKKAYGFGDEIPDKVLEKMGQETLVEYLEKGWIDDGTAAAETAAAEAKVKAEAAAKLKAVAEKEAEVKVESEEVKVESERDALMEKATGYGLTPHYRAGIPKLEAMIEDYEALQALKAEAFELGIDPSDDVNFAELFELVEEKKTENESDS